MRTGSILVSFLILAASAILLAADATQPAATPKTTTTPSGLKITYVSPGEGAKNGDTAAVLYTGKLQDGTVFDASEKHGGEPIDVVIGAGMVIKGWDEGLLGMQVGEKRTLVIPPEIGYGKDGRGPIPPNATLTFDVELIGLRRPPQQAPAAPGR